MNNTDTVLPLRPRTDSVSLVATKPAEGKLPVALPPELRKGLPLVVGVTGHRAFDGADACAALLRDELRWLLDKYGNTPICALSSLAEGADRVFAQAAVDAGIDLYVPLPVAPEAYEAGFPGSVGEFRTLCAKAKAVYVVPGDPADGTDAAYARAGLYIAERSHVLFAIWDGQPEHGLGGTAQVVRFRQTGKLVTADGHEVDGVVVNSYSSGPLDEPEPGFLRHVPVSRAGGTMPAGGGWIPIGAGGQDRNSDPLAKLDHYNKLLMRERGTSRLAPERRQMQANAPAATQRLQDLFTLADAVANRHVGNVRRWMLAVFVVAGAMLLCHAVYVDLWPKDALLAGYAVSLLVVAAGVALIRRAEWNGDAVDHRALAEALRIQLAWHQAGVAEPVSRFYLRRESRELAWVRQALMGASLTVPAGVGVDAIEHVRSEWVEGQASYLARSVANRERTVRRIGALSRFLFVAGIAAAVAMTFNLKLHFVPGGHSGWPSHALEFCATVFPALAGLLSGYIEFSAYEDDIREHDRLLSLFEHGLRSLDGKTLGQQQAALRQLGVEALRENATWALTHKSRAPKAPLG